jgi:hypothetical protein
MDSTATETSTLFPREMADTLKPSKTELSSRQEMVWLAKSGNSIAKLRPSQLSKPKFYK